MPPRPEDVEHVQGAVEPLGTGHDADETERRLGTRRLRQVESVEVDGVGHDVCLVGRHTVLATAASRIRSPTKTKASTRECLIEAR